MSKNDPYLKDARAAVEAFDDGIMDLEAALKRIWELMEAAQSEGYLTSPYIDLTALIDDVKSPDAELEAEAFKSWKS